MRSRLKTCFILWVLLIIAPFVLTNFAFGDGEESITTEKIVSVKPVEKCYQFTASGYPRECGQEISTWLIIPKSNNPCEGEEVWAAYGDGVTCDNIKDDPKNLISDEEGISINTISVSLPHDDKQKTLSHAFVADSECNAIWLRFVNDQKCNIQCRVVNGIMKCR